MIEPGDLLRRLLAAAVQVADPSVCLARPLLEPPCGRSVVAGAGKAAASMAKAFEAVRWGEISGLNVNDFHAILIV